MQQASLKQEDLLKPGDTIRTGRNGRVLLKRGEETILISPNSVVGVPAQKKEGLSTTIVQQAGSILLEVEKRNVQHFEVETPYLAAVVKGTQFRVTIDAGKTSVDVIRGQVQVADFKTGQIAQVMAGQHATAFAQRQDRPLAGRRGHASARSNKASRARLPLNGFRCSAQASPRRATPANGQSAQSSRHAGAHLAKHGVTRISSAIGEVRLNVHRVTHGLARDKSAAHGGTRNAANKDTVWGSSGSGDNSAVANNGQGNGNNAAAVRSAAASASAARSRPSAAPTAAAANNNGNNGNHYGNGNGNGNGNNGNGNGNGANGNGRGNGQANNGNGNGNGNGNR